MAQAVVWPPIVSHPCIMTKPTSPQSPKPTGDHLQRSLPCPSCPGISCPVCHPEAFDPVDFETHAEVLTDLRNRGADEDSARTPLVDDTLLKNALERIKAARLVLTNGEVPLSLRIKTALKIL